LARAVESAAMTLLLVLLLLTGCEDGKTASTPLVVPMPIPAAGWAITQSSSLIAYPGMVTAALALARFPLLRERAEMLDQLRRDGLEDAADQ
jgi:hypothetical protein